CDILLDAPVRARRQAITAARTAVQKERFVDCPRRPQPIRPDLDRRLFGASLRCSLFLLLVVLVDRLADRHDGLLEELSPILVEVSAHPRALIPHDAGRPELVDLDAAVTSPVLWIPPMMVLSDIVQHFRLHFLLKVLDPVVRGKAVERTRTPRH